MNYLYEVELVTKPNVERREIVAAIFAPAEMEAANPAYARVSPPQPS